MKIELDEKRNQAEEAYKTFLNRLDEIQKESEKEEKPEFKVGGWAKVVIEASSGKGNNDSLYYTLGRIFKIRDCTEYSYNHKCNWLIREGSSAGIIENHCSVPTPCEIENHLIEEAKKKGFVVGAKVRGREVKIEAINGHTYSIFQKDYHREIVEIKLIKDTACIRLNGDSDLYFNLDFFELLTSTPSIEVNGYKAEFKEDRAVFGCDEIDKQIFIDLSEILRKTKIGNREIRSVKIGDGEFTRDQITAISSYYTK